MDSLDLPLIAAGGAIDIAGITGAAAGEHRTFGPPGR